MYSARKHREIMPIYLPQHESCVDIDAVTWKGDMQLLTFFHLQGAWWQREDMEKSLLPIIYSLSGFFRPYCRSVMIYHHRKKGNLFWPVKMDMIYVRVTPLRDNISRLKFLESWFKLLQNLFHLFLADRILSFHILHFCHFNKWYLMLLPGILLLIIL